MAKFCSHGPSRRIAQGAIRQTSLEQTVLAQTHMPRAVERAGTHRRLYAVSSNLVRSAPGQIALIEDLMKGRCGTCTVRGLAGVSLYRPRHLPGVCAATHSGAVRRLSETAPPSKLDPATYITQDSFTIVS